MHSSERMTLAFVQGAVREGATVANYLRADEFLLRAGRVAGVRATDRVSGGALEVRARMVLNAAGPWIGQLNGRLREERLTGIVTGLSRGAHIVTRPLTDDCAVALPTRRKARSVIDRGGRHVFVIPWRGHSLIGTTYGPFAGDPDEVAPTDEEVDELLADVNDALGAGTLERSDVVHAYAGLYPLTEEEIRPDVYQGAGDYRVVDHESRDALPGLLSVFGAKYTTARLLAERALDRASEKLGGGFRPCRTRETALPAGEINDLEAYRAARRRELRDDLEIDVIDHLVSCYGRRLDPLLTLLRERPELGARLVPVQPTLAVELLHAAREEMVVHLDDVVFRRTGLGTLGNPGRPVLERAAAIVAEAAGWSAERQRDEVEATLARFPL